MRKKENSPSISTSKNSKLFVTNTLESQDSTVIQMDWKIETKAEIKEEIKIFSSSVIQNESSLPNFNDETPTQAISRYNCYNPIKSKGISNHCFYQNDNIIRSSNYKDSYDQSHGSMTPIEVFDALESVARLNHWKEKQENSEDRCIYFSAVHHLPYGC